MMAIILLIVGVFIGAFLIEFLKRSAPVTEVGNKVKYAARDFRRGFAEGYQGEAARDDADVE